MSNNELIRAYLEIATARKQIAIYKMQIEQKLALKEHIEFDIFETFNHMDPLDALVYYIDTFASKKHAATRALIETERKTWNAQSMERIRRHVAEWPAPEPHLDVVEAVLKETVLRGAYAR